VKCSGEQFVVGIRPTRPSLSFSMELQMRLSLPAHRALAFLPPPLCLSCTALLRKYLPASCQTYSLRC